MEPSCVAIVNTWPETVREDVHRVMTLAGFAEHLAGAGEIVVVAAPAAPRWLAGATEAALDAAGLGSRRLDGATLAAAARSPVRPQAGLPQLARIMPRGITVPEPVVGRPLVLLPSLGADPGAGAVRGLLAWLPSGARRWRRGRPAAVLSDLLQLAREICPRIFVVMDATVCAGVAANVLLAGADPAAVDAAAARLSGREPALPARPDLVGDADACALRMNVRGGRQRRDTPWARLSQDSEAR